MATGATDVPIPVLPATGLAWACRLLFERDGVTVQHSGRPPVPDPPQQSFLVLPNPASARLLVPLGAPAAAATAVRRSGAGAGRAGRLARQGLALYLRAGLGRHRRRRLDVVAEPREAPGVQPSSLLRDHLRHVLGRPDLDFAVLIGPPRLNRKPVLQLIDGHGRVVAYAKAAWNDLTHRLVRNEAATLAALAEAPPASFVAPSLLHHGTWGGLELVVTSALDSGPPPSRAWTGAAPLDTFREIACRSGVRDAPLAESPYWAGMRHRLAGRPDAVAAVEDRFGTTQLRFGSWHGDFTPWNIAAGHGRIRVWDWERAADPVPLGLDVAHFVFQQTARDSRQDPRCAVDASRPRAGQLLASTGLDPGSEEALWLLYGLELLHRYDEARLAGVLARPSAIHAAVLSLFATLTEA